MIHWTNKAEQAEGAFPLPPVYQAGGGKNVRRLFQPLHLIVILVIVFGPGKLPELGEGIGKSIRSFKKALKDGEDAAERERKRENDLPVG